MASPLVDQNTAQPGAHSTPPAPRLTQRYANWLTTNANWVLVLAIVVALGGAWFAKQLPLRSDMANLLPPSAASVKDLRALQKRARAFGTVFAVIRADAPADRDAAAAALAAKLATLPPDLVSNVQSDSKAARDFFWQHRFLFVPLADLQAAHDGLAAKLKAARLAANPLYVDLDDDDDRSNADAADATAIARLDELKRKFAEAEAKAADPGRLISSDGKFALFILQSTFSSSDVPRGKRLLALLSGFQRELAATFGTRAQLELTGTVTVSMYEHASVLEGMALAAGITVLLCGLALWAFYRSLVAVASVLWALTVGVLATFGITYFAIGHLNVMSAFLTAIVVGNGINASLMFLARYLEEKRHGPGLAPARLVARTIDGAFRGTLAAAITSLLAYGSLVVTDFRGFRHFGIIASVGMVVCWIAAFTVLPACLVWLERRGWLGIRNEPALGRWLAKLLPLAPRTVTKLTVALTLACVAVTTVYIATDPFLQDWRDLQSSNRDINRTRALDVELKATMDPRLFAGLSNQLVIGLDDAASVGPVVATLFAHQASLPPGQELFMEIRSVLDLVPADQSQKLDLLARLRTLLDDPALETLDDDERATLERLRPPTTIAPLTFDQVPTSLSWPFVEQDGSVGKLVLLKGSPRFRTWFVADRQAFAQAARALPLPANTTLGGEPLVIADIIDVMERDAPRLVLFSLGGALLTVVVTFGLGRRGRRHAVVTLLCGTLGITAMIAVCFALGIKVHFLDLIALPITIGIGIEYAVNIAARDREDGHLGPQHVITQTGGAVFLCSFTTTVGYGSLLLSANGGIRAFGLAAMIGEITCLVAAVFFAPPILAAWRGEANTNPRQLAR